jgi:tetraacyldisaccharide 4'-kinase
LFPYLLLPFAVLYQGITSLRNLLYEKQFFKTTPTPIFSINVGNLRVGGTGKTPHIEYLIRLLADKYQIATLSRGYGRKTKGFLIANKQSDVATIGDEPMQFFSKFKHKIIVTVGEKRVAAVEKIAKNVPKINLILLDDAFQHRAIQANLNLLLTTYDKPFYDDFLMPAGRLREGKAGAKRANAVIVSKCPIHLEEEEKRRIKEKIYSYLPDKEIPIFFSTITYQPFEPVFASFSKQKHDSQQPIILLTGIANAQLLQEKIAKEYHLLTHIALADHHHYTQKSAEKISKTYQKLQHKNPIILTTEKDFVKLQSPEIAVLLQHLPLYYLPIAIEFLPSSIEFDTWVLEQ